MPIGASRLPQLESHYILQTALSYNSSARDAEITRLLARLGAEPYPYVVAGDFNMSEDATTYSKIADTMGMHTEKGAVVGVVLGPLALLKSCRDLSLRY